MSSRVNLRSALAAATAAARAAGPLLVRAMGRPAHVDTKRSAIDLVTEIDRRSERLIFRLLRRRFPDHGFHGEEQGHLHPNAAWQWLIDPLDGTTNFVHGIPAFAISIGLLHQNIPMVGVVYDPTRREYFTGIRGRGAWLNGRRMRVSRASRIADSLLSTGFSEKFRANPAPYIRWFTAFQRRCHAVRRMGSSALSLAYVACGRQEGFYEQDLWPWDVAAGMVLIEEAGGALSDFLGQPVTLPRTRTQLELLASNGRIHHAMLQLLQHPA